MKHMKGYIDWFVVALIAFVLLACVGLPVLAVWSSAYKCGLIGHKMGLETDWGFIQGCLVTVGERQVPIEFIRIVDDKIIIEGE